MVAPTIRAQVERVTIDGRTSCILTPLCAPAMKSWRVDGDVIAVLYRELATIPGWQSGDLVRIVDAMADGHPSYLRRYRVHAGQAEARSYDAESEGVAA